jgi:PEP-CTERM motif
MIQATGRADAGKPRNDFHDTYEEFILSIRSIAFAVVALALAICTGSAKAASVTYDFIEGSTAPNPGMIGGIFVIASPPASATSGWSGDYTDVISYQITDPSIGMVGFYTPTEGTVSSSTGAELDGGGIGSVLGANVTNSKANFAAGTLNSSGHTLAHGTFVLAAAVPEPSSLVLAGTAALAGLGLWTRRRRV